MPSWSEVPDEIKKRLPAPPERCNFPDDESFEEARGAWQGGIGRVLGLVKQQEASVQRKAEGEARIREIKASLLAQLDEWIGADIPDEESEDYATWQERLEAIDSIQSMDDVMSYAEEYERDTAAFLRRWGLSD